MVASLKPKVATVVQDQVPMYFNSSYPQFVKFLEKYYEWMESDGNPLAFVRNILEQHDYDTADEKFKLLLETGVLTSLPTTLNIDKSILIKNAKAIFRSKGSPKSYTIMLRALFDEYAQLTWGKDMYLRLNDSTFVKDTIITVRRPKIEGTAYLDQTRLASISLDKNDFGFLSLPALTLVRNDPVEKDIPIFSFNLSGSITSINLTNAGYGYTTAVATVTGDILGGGTPATVAVVIGADSSISSVSVSNFGAGYTELPVVTITGDGVGATVSVSWSAVMNDISITHPGSGFETAPRLEFIGGTGVVESAGDGDSVVLTPAPTARAYCTIDSDGRVDSVNLTSYGVGYQYKPELKLKWLPDQDAEVQLQTQGTNVLGVRVVSGGRGYTVPPTVVFTTDTYDYNMLVGNRITQTLPNRATAIVESVLTQTVDGEEFIVLKLRADGLVGDFTVGSIVESSFGGVSVAAVVEPMLTTIDITDPGSMYQKGQHVDFITTNGTARAQIDEISRGKVEEVIVVKGGQDYIVGDSIVAAGGATGDGFEATVATIDGIGAKVTPIMQISEAIILDGGSKYEVGDVLQIYGGDSDVNLVSGSSFAQATVTETAATDNVVGFAVDAGGYGYTSGVSIAILPTPSSLAPLRQIRPDKSSFELGVLAGSPGDITIEFKPKSSSLSSVVWNLTDPDLGDNDVTTIVNGALATVAIDTVSGSPGPITKLDITGVGINYVTPKLIFDGGTSTPTVELSMTNTGALIPHIAISSMSWSAGVITLATSTPHGFFKSGWLSIHGATPSGYNGIYYLYSSNIVDPSTLKVEKASSLGAVSVLGTVAGYAILDAGAGYTVASVVSVVDTSGTGALVRAELDYGAVRTLEFNTRGALDEINKYGARGYTVLGGSGTGISLDLYYQVKEVRVDNPGAYYSDYTLTPSEAHGSGASMIATINDGVIVSFDLTDPGLNYAYCAVRVATATGTGFEASVQLNGSGSVTSIDIINPGKGYLIGDTVEFIGTAVPSTTITPATAAILVIRDGVISNVEVKDGGSLYHPDCMLRVIPSRAPGSREAILSPVISSGQLQSVAIIDGGADYSATDTVELYYLEETIDADPNALFRGVGTYPDYSAALPKVGSGVYTSTTITVTNATGIIVGMVVEGEGVLPGTTVTSIASAPDITISAPLILPISSATINFIPVDTVQYGTATVAAPSNAWPAKSFGIVNSVFPVLDMYDIWPENSGTATDAIYGINQTISGQLGDIKLVAGGAGYYSSTERLPLTLEVVSGTGTGAVLRAVLQEGSIVDVIVTDGGEGYVDLPSIVVSGGNVMGTPATLVPIMEGGSVVGVSITNPGTGYYYGTSAYISGNGIGASVSVTVETGITEVVVIDPGQGYTSTGGVAGVLLTVTDVAPAGVQLGSGAELQAVVENGKVVSVKVISPGEGYHAPTIAVTGGAGVGCAVSAVVRRPIKSIVLTSAGRGYIDASVVIVGDGVGALATVSPSKSSLEGVTVLYSGNRYATIPEITITDTSRFGAVSSVSITDQGSGYQRVPVLTISAPRTEAPYATGAEVVGYSTSIGKVKSVKFQEFPIGEPYVPVFGFPINAIMSENSTYLLNEIVYLDGHHYDEDDYSDGPRARVRSIDYDRNLVVFDSATDEYVFVTESGDTILAESETQLNNIESTTISSGLVHLSHEDSNGIPSNSTLVGSLSGARGRILKMNRAAGTGIFGVVGTTPKVMTSSRGMLNDNKTKIHNNMRYQDFAYVVNTGLALSDYEAYLDKLVHPAGFSMYGDVVVNTNLSVSRVARQNNTLSGSSAISDIISLYFTLLPVMFDYNKKEPWRFENDRIQMHLDDNIPTMEALLADGYDTTTTFPAEIVSSGTSVTGTYATSGGVITVTKAAHGLTDGAVVTLDFTTGGSVSDMFSITYLSSSTFSVSQAAQVSTSVTFDSSTEIPYSITTQKLVGQYASYRPSGGYSMTASTDVIVEFDNLKPAGGRIFKIGDTISVAFITNSGTVWSRDGAMTDGVYAITGATDNTITFVYATSETKTGSIVFSSAVTDGDVVITNVASKTLGMGDFTPWVSGSTYNINNGVMYNHTVYNSMKRHVSNGSNTPQSATNNWAVANFTDQLEYDFT